MKASNLCLQMDVGNSSVKWRLMSDADIIARGKYHHRQGKGLDRSLASVDAPGQIWISSVATAEKNEALASQLSKLWGVKAWFPQSQAQTGKLRNSYSQPEKMGVDRWLAMLGATRHAPGRFAVVDAGSALTIDVVDEFGAHEGGYIIPGPELMERALLLDTDRVRFEEDVDYELVPGKSTAQAVRHGIAAAQAGAVRLVLARAGLQSPELLFCGGGAEALMSLVAIGGILRSDLVFEGLEEMAAIDSNGQL